MANSSASPTTQQEPYLVPELAEGSQPSQQPEESATLFAGWPIIDEQLDFSDEWDWSAPKRPHEKEIAG